MPRPKTTVTSLGSPWGAFGSPWWQKRESLSLQHCSLPPPSSGAWIFLWDWHIAYRTHKAFKGRYFKISSKKEVLGLERQWFSNEERWLFYPKTWVWSPALTLCLPHLPVIPAPGNPMPSACFLGCWMHVVYTKTSRHTHTLNKIHKYFLKKRYGRQHGRIKLELTRTPPS